MAELTPEMMTLCGERAEALKAVVRQTNPKRIPIMSNTRLWPIFDSGYKLTDAMANMDVIFESACRMQEKYKFDCYNSLGLRFPFKVYEALGSSPYVINTKNDTIQGLNIPAMRQDEYEVLIKDGSKKFYFEKVFPRRFQLRDTENAISALARGVEAQIEVNRFDQKLIRHMTEHYGVPVARAGYAIKNPVEYLWETFRGMIGFSMDMRQVDEGLIQRALEVIDDGRCDNICRKIGTRVDKDTEVFDFNAVMHTHTWLSVTQFGKFYWPRLKKLIDATVSANKIGYIFAQGSMAHLISYFQEIPKGHFVLMVEKDDIAELRRKLPNLSFIGGFPSQLLGYGSEENCIDYAKKMIDEIGYDGRLIVSTDKSLAFRNDAKGSNMEAVNNFILEYGVYK